MTRSDSVILFRKLGSFMRATSVPDRIQNNNVKSAFHQYPREGMGDIQTYHRVFIIVQLLGIGIISIGWMGQLGLMIGLPTPVGIGIGLFLAISAVFQEFVDNDVITDPTAEPGEVFSDHQQQSFLKSRYFMWGLMALMILLGTLQNFIRYESFMSNGLMDFGLAASVPWLYHSLVYLVAGCSALGLMTLMLICYLKLYHRVMVPNYSHDPISGQNATEQHIDNGVIPRFMRWLNGKVNFDRFMFLSMVFGSLIYFGAEFANVCDILHAFFPLMSTWQIMSISALNGCVTFSNQMMLWGYNNKKFFVEHLQNGEQQSFPWLDTLQCGMYVRRCMLYLRDFLLCVVDVMNAMLLVSMAYGKPLGITLILVSMLNAWVKTYFQSCEEVKSAQGKPDANTQALEQTTMNQLFKSLFSGVGWVMDGIVHAIIPQSFWSVEIKGDAVKGASSDQFYDDKNKQCAERSTGDKNAGACPTKKSSCCLCK